ncbi:Krueppel-like factor 8 [Temnothorax longispinosus]|uniref:Krueppel-like factor 8 n=1 Tax=Temnothorax longispinosus TaxID=300112 RepID=A0A4S2K092_9HYME|nr:Krueppel-like factor 8 [Temnothorax longispinosus]
MPDSVLTGRVVAGLHELHRARLTSTFDPRSLMDRGHASPSLPPLGETAWDRDHGRDRSRERNRERERERVRERSGENEREREPAIRERERERDRDRDRQRDRERDRERDVSVCMMEPPDSVFISPSAALLALQRIKDASLRRGNAEENRR